MREFWKRTAIRAAIGFVPGVLMGLGFMAVYGIGKIYAEKGAGWMALELALSGLLGSVNIGTTTIYSLERWGVLRCTLVHFAIAMSNLLVIGFLLGWFDWRDPTTLWLIAVCVVAYFCIWLVMYLRGRRQIRRMNEALKTWKAAQSDE